MGWHLITYANSERHRVNDLFWGFPCSPDVNQDGLLTEFAPTIEERSVSHNASNSSGASNLTDFTGELASRVESLGHMSDMDNENHTRYLIQLSSQMLTVLDGCTNFLILFCSNSRYRREFQRVLLWDRIVAVCRRIGSLLARLRRLKAIRGRGDRRSSCHCQYQDNFEMLLLQSPNANQTPREQNSVVPDFAGAGQAMACYHCEKRCGKPKSLSTLGIGWPLEQPQKKEKQRPRVLQQLLQKRATPQQSKSSSSTSNRQRAGAANWADIRVVAKLHPAGDGDSADPYCLFEPIDDMPAGEQRSHDARQQSECAHSALRVCGRGRDAGNQNDHPPRFRCRFETPPHSSDAAACSCGAGGVGGDGGVPVPSGRSNSNSGVGALRYYVWRSRSYAICQMESAHSRSRARELLGPSQPAPGPGPKRVHVNERLCHKCAQLSDGSGDRHGCRPKQQEKERRPERDSQRDTSDEELHELHSQGHLSARRHTHSNARSNCSSGSEGHSLLHPHEPNSKASCFTEPILVACGTQSSLRQTPAAEMRSVV